MILFCVNVIKNGGLSEFYKRLAKLKENVWELGHSDLFVNQFSKI